MNIFKQFIRSIYSPRDIASFRNQGIGKTILYVFLLSLLSIIPTMIYFNSAITNGISSAQDTIEEEFPSFSIKNGELHAEQKEPIFHEQGDFTVVFDSTGALSKANLKNQGNTIGLLKNEFVFIAGGQVESYPYSMLTDLVISKNDFLHFLDKIESSIGLIVAIVSVVSYLFTSATQFIKISILAIFGLILKNTLKKNIQYRHLWRMSAYAVTLPTVFFLIMSAIKTNVPSGYLIDFFVALIMLLLAIREIPSQVDPD